MATSASTRSFPTGVDCPVEGCSTSGSEPGLKRHIAKKHNLSWTDFFAGSIKTAKPARNNVPDLIKDPVVNTDPQVGLADLKADELRQMAKGLGVEGWHKMRKSELVEALSI